MSFPVVVVMVTKDGVVVMVTKDGVVILWRWLFWGTWVKIAATLLTHVLYDTSPSSLCVSRSLKSFFATAASKINLKIVSHVD